MIKNKKGQLPLRVISFGAIVIGGLVISFSNNLQIQAIGGVIISIGVAIASFAN